MITLRIDEILAEKGKSRYWLAKEIGMSQNNFSKMCNNETSSIKFETLEKICNLLDCTPNQLIKTTDPTLSRLLAYQFETNKSLNKADIK